MLQHAVFPMCRQRQQGDAEAKIRLHESRDGVGMKRINTKSALEPLKLHSHGELIICVPADCAPKAIGRHAPMKPRGKRAVSCGREFVAIGEQKAVFFVWSYRRTAIDLLHCRRKENREIMNRIARTGTLPINECNAGAGIDQVSGDGITMQKCDDARGRCQSGGPIRSDWFCRVFRA